MIDLTGLHVLVTGGSRGIGAATARLFGRAGATVMIQYRERESEAEALVDELLTISNREHRRFPCDFSEPSEIVELFQFVGTEWGKLDCLVNNAGVWQHNPMSDFNEDRFIETMRINVRGPFLALREALPYLRMSKQEIKEEMKRMDGDPLMKQRRARVARQLAMQRIGQAVPKADVVVTNPTHFAVALQYDGDSMKAPKVVAKGADFLAMRIRQLAIANGIPLVERKELARSLYAAVEPGQEVPPQFYNAVAEILEREPLGLDIVFECSGQQAALDNAVSLLRPGGKLSVIGIPEVDRISFAPDQVRRKELTIVNVRRQCGCVEAALDLISRQPVAVRELITHHFPFNQSKAAFDLVANYQDGVVKAMIEFE